MQTDYTGLERSVVYRWFTDPGRARPLARRPTTPMHSRSYAASPARGPRARPTTARRSELVDALLRRSPEFAALWERHEVATRADTRKRIAAPRGRR